jgi:hypothetical protein
MVPKSPDVVICFVHARQVRFPGTCWWMLQGFVQTEGMIDFELCLTRWSYAAVFGLSNLFLNDALLSPLACWMIDGPFAVCLVPEDRCAVDAPLGSSARSWGVCSYCCVAVCTWTFVRAYARAVCLCKHQVVLMHGDPEEAGRCRVWQWHHRRCRYTPRLGQCTKL